MEQRRTWIVVVLVGLALIALTPGLAMMGDVAAPLWLGPIGFGLVLIGAAGFVWSAIVAARRSRRPGDVRHDPVHDRA